MKKQYLQILTCLLLFYMGIEESMGQHTRRFPLDDLNFSTSWETSETVYNTLIAVGRDLRAEAGEELYGEPYEVEVEYIYSKATIESEGAFLVSRKDVYNAPKVPYIGKQLTSAVAAEGISYSLKVKYSLQQANSLEDNLLLEVNKTNAKMIVLDGLKYYILDRISGESRPSSLVPNSEANTDIFKEQPSPNFSIWLGTKQSPQGFKVHTFNRTTTKYETLEDSVDFIIPDDPDYEDYNYISIWLNSGQLKIEGFDVYPLPCINDPSFESLAGNVDQPSNWGVVNGNDIDTYTATNQQGEVFTVSPVHDNAMLMLNANKRVYCQCNSNNIGTAITEDNIAYLIQNTEFVKAENYSLAFFWQMPPEINKANQAPANNIQFSLILSNMENSQRQEFIITPTLNTGGNGSEWVYEFLYFKSNDNFDKLELRLKVSGNINPSTNCQLESCNYTGGIIPGTDTYRAATVLIDDFAVIRPQADFTIQDRCFPNPYTLTSTSTVRGADIIMNEWWLEHKDTTFADDFQFKAEAITEEELERIKSFDYEFPWPGKYQITLRSTSGCLTTDTEVKDYYVQGFEEKVYTQSSTVKKYQEVLATQSATFSNAQLTDLTDYNQLLDELSYKNGQQGIWRPDASYAYVEDRVSSWSIDQPYAEVNLSNDGTFEYKGFEWQHAPMELINGWKQVAEISKYNPMGAEVENRDILGIYSAALFDAKGELSTAIASNSQHSEMGFAGFESYEEDEAIERSHIGHFSLLESHKNRLDKKTLNMSAGHEDMITVEWLYDDIEAIKDQIFYIKGRTVMHDDPSKIGEEFIVSKATFSECYAPHPTKVGWCIIDFNGFGFEGRGVWLGEIVWYEAGIEQIQVNGKVTTKRAHTGNRSLEVRPSLIRGLKPDLDGDNEEEGSRPIVTRPVPSIIQHKLKLNPGEEYHFSAWASVTNLANEYTAAEIAMKTVVADGLKVVIGYTVLGEEVQIATIKPSGTIIEGWQRMEGSFIIPNNAGKLTLSFYGGFTKEAYFDDLRLFPADGNLISYVYEPNTYRLKATLDNNNYATLYYYDEEGNLRITKKETARGVKTIQTTQSYTPPTNTDLEDGE